MINLESRIAKAVCYALSLSLFSLSTPGFAIAASIASRNARPAMKIKKKAQAPSRLLTGSALKTLKGSDARCPYVAGSSKWALNMEGVDLLTGNYSTAVTDLKFEGGYGIPVEITRAYSVNDGNDGPFGIGWSFTADLRTTAGGIIKKPGSAIHATPVSFRERPSLEADPNSSTQPVEATVSDDSSGKLETIQRDVDGVLSTPPYDKNVIDSTYQYVTGTNGSLYRILLTNKVTTPDGTVYVYTKQGSYPNGTVPYNSPNATPEPSNVLKISTVTDRQGNLTTYTYSGSPVTYQKTDGQTSENVLTNVQMPNGHVVNLNYTGSHVTSVSDGFRTVNYGYTNGLLTSVTTPGGRTTTYGYGAADYDPNNIAQHYSITAPQNLLKTITDPRGLTTTMKYCLRQAYIQPYNSSPNVPAIYCSAIYHPDGSISSFVDDYLVALNTGGTNLPSLALVYVTGNTEVIPTNYSNEGVNFSLPLNQRIWYTCAVSRVVSGTTNNFPSYSIEVGYPNFAQSPPGNGGSATYAFNPPPVGTPFYDMKSYDAISQDLLAEQSGNPFPVAGTAWPTPSYSTVANHNFSTNAGADHSSSYTSTNYNFLGKPLDTTSWETDAATGNTTIYSAATSYAYWDSSKYFQQKAVKDPAGRYSYTDYYDNNAAQGSKGNTKYVYDQQHGGFYLDTTVQVPTYSQNQGIDWKYQLKPGSAANYSGYTLYDSRGRATDVYKLQNATTSPWTYVHTTMSYGADSSPWWGEPTAVTEDAGGVNRTTQTLAYDAAGRATIVQDAANRQITTTYDLDGLIQGVARTDGAGQQIATYTYGSSGITNGVPVQVTDNLSGVTETFGYVSSGPGVGGTASVAESNASYAPDNYTVSYTYAGPSERSTATYTTPYGTTKWAYLDYKAITAGQSGPIKRAPQTLNKLDANGNLTDEEMDYSYDGHGRLAEAAFAQSHNTGYTGNLGYEDGTNCYQADKRAHETLTYDSQGRVLNVNYAWEQWNGTTLVSSVPFFKETNNYDTVLALKTGKSVYKSDGNGGLTLDHSESYGYDANRDWLTSASYGDGLPNANVSWTYDDAGNRASDTSNSGSWSYDNLNRMTASPAGSYGNDILGNRTSAPGGQSYGWDFLNRLSSYSNSSGTWNYSYRADGLRVMKAAPTQTSWSFYDGQMPMQEVDVTSSGTAVTVNGVGPRGLDYMAKASGSNTTVVFPIYDSHGNMVCDVSRSGTSYSLNDWRTYDAWGSVRIGNTTGDPKGRYCANLGHKQDDESGLIYMRARYYEPTSGRFVSEDRAMHGLNWFEFAGNCPAMCSDVSGKDWQSDLAAALACLNFLLNSWINPLPDYNPNSVPDKLQDIIGKLNDGVAEAIRKKQETEEQIDESIDELIAEFEEQEVAAVESAETGIAEMELAEGASAVSEEVQVVVVVVIEL